MNKAPDLEMANAEQSSLPTYFHTTARIGFRHWTKDDGDLASALWGNAKVTQFIDARGILTEADIQAKLNIEIQSQTDFGIQYWPMFLKENEQHIGCCGVRPKDPDNGILEFGIHLRPDYWGRGLAVEAGSAVIRHVFGQKLATELFAGHNPRNEASRHLLRRLGFTYVGDEFYPPTGLQHPSYRLKAE